MLQLQHVRREYGGMVAVADVDLTVDGGEGMVLLGHNGSGKTTTLAMAAGQLRPTSGRVWIDGRNVHEGDQRQVRARLAFVRDSPVFYPDLTVVEHLGLVAVAHGVEGEIDERVDELLGEFELDDRRDYLPEQLSSGMQQKLQLACTFLRRADVLLLDEAGRALDPAARQIMWSRLIARKQAGAGVVFTSHQLDFPAELVDRAMILRDGVVETDGPLDEVLDSEAAARLGFRR